MLALVQTFIRDEGRIPTRTARTPEERRLGNWLAYQRRTRTLNPAQRTTLEALTGWLPDGRDERWDARLAAFVDFTAREGRPPRLRSTDPGERSIAAWCRRQDRAEGDGSLRYDRLVEWRRARVRVPRGSNARNPTPPEG